MRGRGSYRPLNNSNNVKTENVIKIEDSDEIEFVAKKRKSFENEIQVLNVITIEDSDEEEIQTIDNEEIHTIDNDYGSMCIVDDKPVINKCFKCLSLQLSNDYNCLTSADFYFNPRIHPSVLSIELKDKNRFNCFNTSIAENKDLIKDKIVLVIGSGNGILALFAAKALAKTVIVVERKGMVGIIESVIDRNIKKLCFNRTKFVVIEENINEMVLPNNIDCVDVIVSDWVNHSLFYKSMFLYFIKARDKWLKKGGLMIPDSGHMYLVGAHDYIHKHTKRDKKNSQSLYVRRIDYWDQNVYGFDMTSVRSRVLKEPIHESIDGKQVITNEYLLKYFDFYKMSIKDINFSTSFQMNAIKDNYLHIFVLLFEVVFTKNLTVPLMFSTRPNAPKILFKPTVLFLDNKNERIVYKEDKIRGVFKHSLSQDLNQLSIEIEFRLKNNLNDKSEQMVYKTV